METQILQRLKNLRNFDRFFDCLNVRCMQEGIQKQKPDLRPYKDPSDSRLVVRASSHRHTYAVCHTQTLYLSNNFVYTCQWLKEGFLRYLDNWETSVNSRVGFTTVQRNMMMLSQQTLEGLKITGMHVLMCVLSTLDYHPILQLILSRR